MHKHKAFLLSVLIIFSLWLLLAGTDRDEIITAAAVSVVLSLAFSSRLEVLQGVRLNPKALLFIPPFVVVFLIALVQSTWDVACRVVSPSLPINPGIVKVKTRLKSPLGRIILANAITLTPGTMTVETEGEDFFIHWIDIQCSDVEAATEKIVGGFEKYLEVIFG